MKNLYLLFVSSRKKEIIDQEQKLLLLNQFDTMDLFPLIKILKNLYIPITITIVNGYDSIKKWLLKNISTTAKAVQT